MPDQKQSRANGLWIKLVLLLLAIIGFFGKRTLDAMDARQAETETKVNEIDKKVDVLTAKVNMSIGETTPGAKTTAQNLP